jgi:CTP synthase
MLKEKLDIVVLSKLKLNHKTDPPLAAWRHFITTLKNPAHEVTIGLVGKYVELKDAYKSIAESIIHAGVANNCRVNVKWIHSEHITDENVGQKLANLSGILVAPGFGDRGIEGKLVAARYAREKKVPYFGICLGMQCAVIEFGQHVLGLQDANSTEMNAKTKHPVIAIMEEQKKITRKGGTMRLGSYPCALTKGSKLEAAYGELQISERHRHRYEFNNSYLKDYEKAGMLATGINPDSGLVEAVELKDHPWFVGVQYHPEYKSTVARPHPLFVKFVEMAMKQGK